MDKVTKSLKISSDVWKKLKVYCAERDTTISEFIERVVVDKMKK